MLTTMVRAVSRSRPCPSVWKKTPRLSAARSMETRTTLQSRKGESSGAFASRGRRSIVPGSPGSKASTKPSVTASTRLIHKIWVAVIGKVKPMRIASRSEEHTSELQSLMRISYAVFCLKKKRKKMTNDKHSNDIYNRNEHKQI